MKKYTMAALALALCCAMLVGCGCMNSNADPTVPSTKAPTTAPTTAATQAPTTMPTTEAESQPTDITGGISETAGEDGMVDTQPDSASGETGNSGNSEGAGDNGSAKGRSGRAMTPMG